MRWGLLPSFVKDPKQFPTLINARAEEVLDKPSFRHAMRYRRCLVVADGFYEWTGPKGKRRPFLLRPREPQLIAFAGIYERWRDQEGGETDTVAILTCPANRTVAALHDRMPVVLPFEHFAAWLDVKATPAEAALALLQPAADDLFEAIEMHPKINDSKRDEPGIQEPLEPSLLRGLTDAAS
jgi:putative SOS response-associated peptidase YedK